MKSAIVAALILAGLGAVVTLSTTFRDRTVFRTGGNVSPDHPFSVTMSPMGEVRFPRVPRRIVTLDANYNDMLVAIGEGKSLVATGYRPNFYNGFYQKLDLKSQIDQQKLAYLSSGGGGQIDKEIFYSLHADVHHIDPIQLAASRGWTETDVEEIARNVGPFFGNRYSRDNNYKGGKPYQYYSLWELSAKVGQVYHRESTVARLKAVYDEMVQSIQSRLPPVDKRPRAGLIYYNNGKFTPYSLGQGGFGQAQYADVGARDAFATIAGSTYGASGGQGGMLDKEGLMALDPDVLIVPFAIYPASGGGTSHADYDRLMELGSDPLIQRLAAFRNKRVYPGGTPLQGPIFYLFQIEMAAKQIYPEIFGTYRDDQNYPPEEQLFDRRRAGDIVKDDER